MIDTEQNNQFLSFDQHVQEALFLPAQEFLSRGGKGARGLILQLGFEIACLAHRPNSDESSRAKQNLVDLGHALELVHSGSLIVDDIQDGSRVRRGKASLHEVYGVGPSLNVGNWLYFEALNHLHRLPLCLEQKYELLQHFHEALCEGHKGQAVDLTTNVLELKKEIIEELCIGTMRAKTGSLTALAIMCGASLIQPKASCFKIKSELDFFLKGYGRDLGVYLQIFDDLINLVGGRDFEKRWEDLMQKRLCLVWWVASTRLSLEAYEELRSLVQRQSYSSSPEVSLAHEASLAQEFENWSGSFPFFEEAERLALQISDKLRERLNQFYTRVAEKDDPYFENVLNTLDQVLGRIRSTYENFR